jgi:hypothetical protein
MGRRLPNPSRWRSDGTELKTLRMPGHQLLLGTQPVLEILAVGGTAGEEKLIGALRDLLFPHCAARVRALRVPSWSLEVLLCGLCPRGGLSRSRV